MVRKGDKVYCHSEYIVSTYELLTKGNFYKVKDIYNDDSMSISTNSKTFTVLCKNHQDFSIYYYSISKYRKMKLEKINSL